MKKLCAVTLASVLLLISIACSSIPKGTESIDQLQKNAAARIGQNVIVVGMAETKTPMASSSFKMFKVYQDNNSMWVTLQPGTEMPPQGVNVRVSGTLQQKQFSVIGQVYYIEANQPVKME